MNMDLFGVKICERRINLRLTQEDIAKTLGVSPQAVSKWERGLSIPDVSIIVELARKLEISLDELLLESDYYKVTDNIDKKIVDPLKVIHPELVEVQIGEALIPMFTDEDGLETIVRIREKIAIEFGVFVHPIRVRDSIDIEPETVILLIKGNNIASNQIKLTPNGTKKLGEFVLGELIKHLPKLMTLKGTKILLDNLKDTPFDIVDDIIPEHITLIDFHKMLVEKVKKGEYIGNLGEMLEQLVI